MVGKFLGKAIYVKRTQGKKGLGQNVEVKAINVAREQKERAQGKVKEIQSLA